jgi:hypothetical protein
MQPTEPTAATTRHPAVPNQDRMAALTEILAIGWAALDSIFEPGGPLERFVFDASAFEVTLRGAGGPTTGAEALHRAQAAPHAVQREAVLERLYTPAFRKVLRLAVRHQARSPRAEIAHGLGLRIAAQALDADYAARDCPVARALFEAAWTRRTTLAASMASPSGSAAPAPSVTATPALA